MAIPEDDLLEFLDEEFKPAEQEGWKIKSDDEANWALRKIKQNRDQLTAKKELVAREKERLDRWLESETESLERSINFFETALFGYYKDAVAKGLLGNKKSLKLPYGTLQMRKKQAKLERDDNKLIEIARPLGLIKVKESLDWAEFKKRLIIDGYKVIDKESGEVLDAIQVIEPECDEFSVKVD
jgi:uncharacterized protein (DUF3084 family)